MSKSIQTTQQQETLSRLLDEMNCGRHPQSGDPETAELLTVAAMVKDANLSMNPPQHLVDQTVKQILAELPSHRPKHFRGWIYSGVLGTAASILLIIGLHLVPLWSPIPAQPIHPETQSPALERPVEELSPADTPAGSQADDTKSIRPPAAITGNAPPAIEPIPANPSVPSAAFTPPPPSDQTPTTAPIDKITSVPSAPVPVPKKSHLTDTRHHVAGAQSVMTVAEILPLSLPGKVPSSVSVDRANGTVRQIFDQGTPSEVIIVQRLRSTDADLNRSVRPDVMMEKTNALSETMNTVTIIIDDQEVTLTSRQTPQELQQLAKALQQP